MIRQVGCVLYVPQLLQGLDLVWQRSELVERHVPGFLSCIFPLELFEHPVSKDADTVAMNIGSGFFIYVTTLL